MKEERKMKERKNERKNKERRKEAERRKNEERKNGLISAPAGRFFGCCFGRSDAGYILSMFHS